MILTHYSEKPLQYDPCRKYGLTGKVVFKPDGLWLSDDRNEQGWREWCVANRFRTDTLVHRADFLIDTRHVILIESAAQFLEFNSKYKTTKDDYRSSLIGIDWESVKRDAAGLIITPYRYEFRLDYVWYYGWDCASGVVWDLSALSPTNLDVSPMELPASLPSEQRGPCPGASQSPSQQ